MFVNIELMRVEVYRVLVSMFLCLSTGCSCVFHNKYYYIELYICRHRGYSLWANGDLYYRLIRSSLYSYRKRYYVYIPKGYRSSASASGHHPPSARLCADKKPFRRHHLSSTGPWANGWPSCRVCANKGHTIAIITVYPILFTKSDQPYFYIFLSSMSWKKLVWALN